MILTEEQIKADNERWKGRDLKQELYYLSYAVPNRLSVTNDDLRFNAFVARKALGMIENIQPEPCEDAVSREEVLNCLEWQYPDKLPRTKIMELPHVIPKQRTGRWNDCDPICPVCGEDKFKDLDADIWADWKPKFCPNCGAKMEGVAE